MAFPLRNHNPMVLVNSFDSYCSTKPPDCSLYSEDGYEFSVHKELLCQTKFLCVIVNSANLNCCNKLEVMFPSLSKKGTAEWDSRGGGLVP